MEGIITDSNFYFFTFFLSFQMNGTERILHLNKYTAADGLSCCKFALVLFQVAFDKNEKVDVFLDDKLKLQCCNRRQE